MTDAFSYFDERIRRGELGHAYLIEMEEGPERLALGRRIAARLFCEEGTGCGRCRACRTVLSGNHPDVLTVTHEKPRVISVDEIRQQLVGSMTIRPYRAEYKIYLVDEAEKLNIAAQNALLKTLEEPPEYGIMLLFSGNRDAFLPTILSRVVTVRQSQQEEAEKEGTALLLQYLRRTGALTVTEMAGIAAACKEKGLTPEDMALVLRRALRDVLLLKSGARVPLSYPEEREALQDLAGLLRFPQVNGLWEALGELEARLRANGSPDNLFEIFFLRLRELLAAAGED